MTFRQAMEDLRTRLRRVTGSGDYLAQIDGLRFFAIAPVVLFHLGSRTWRAFEPIVEDPSPVDRAALHLSNQLFAGRTGVELFFVISGFIIAYPFVRAAQQLGPAPRLRAFYTRRLTRLEPPYILALLGTFSFLVLSGTSPLEVGESGHPLWKSLLASLFYLHGLLFRELPDVLPVAWSLEVEFEFYVLAPLLFAAYFAVRAPRLRALVGVVAVLLLMAAINPLQARIGELIRFVLPRFVHLFLIGVVFCDLYVQSPPPPPERRRGSLDLLFVLGLVIVVVTEPAMPDYRRQTLLGYELLRAASYAAMFVAAFYGRFTPKLLAWAWIPTIGGMCYTIYLTHLPIQQVLTSKIIRWARPETFAEAWAIAAVGTMPVVAAVAIGYFLLIEKPFMRRSWPWLSGARGHRT